MRFTTSTAAPNRPCTAVAKGFPGNPRPPARSALTEAVWRRSNIAKAPARSVTSAVVTCIAWGNPCVSMRDMTLDSRHLLACVIALVPSGVRVLDALGVHDTAAGLLFPSIALSGRANRFFLGLLQNGILTRPGRSLQHLAGNTCSKYANWGSPRAAFATGTRFSRGTARRRKRHTSPRCRLVRRSRPTPTSDPAHPRRIAPG